MNANPYEPPQANEPAKAPSHPWYRRQRPLWGYLVSVVYGAMFLPALMPFLEPFDDTGFIQMTIGALLALAIYVLVF